MTIPGAPRVMVTPQEDTQWVTTPWGHPSLQPYPHRARPPPWAEVLVATSSAGAPAALVATSSVGGPAGRVVGAGGALAAGGEHPAPLPCPGAHARALGPVQGTGMYWGVSSEAPGWWQRGRAAPWVGTEGFGGSSEHGGQAQALPEVTGPSSPRPRCPPSPAVMGAEGPTHSPPGSWPATVCRRG